MLTSSQRLLRDLIALPSVNPAFLPNGDPHSGELALAEHIAATAAKAGLAVSLKEVLPGRPNVLAVLSPPRRCRSRVLLVPHLDTVGAEDPAAFTPRLRAGRMHGRGACDTKGSLAAMLSALTRLAQAPRRPASTEIVLAAVIDEENHQAGSRALARAGWKAGLAIVGEPTGLRVVTAHKGNLWLQIETRGKAAHGCCPHLGHNAIRDMGRVVEMLEGPYAEELRRREHPLLGRPTINVGTIHGGVQPNVVPDTCRITVDRRTLPSESEAGVRREIRSLLETAAVRAKLVDLRGVPCPALETSPDLPLVRSLLQVARQRAPAGADYFCDAAVLAAAGIPSVVFGPGSIAQAHTRDEWIALQQVESATRLLGRFLAGLD
jgi:succinyl-diaminopimelate desuccinylase